MLSKLIEEAYVLHENQKAKTRAETWDNTGNTMERIAGLADVVPFGGSGLRTVSGFQAGHEIGHPIAGALVGREGALGAASRHDKSIGIGDVYTKKNMLNHAIAAGAGLVGMAGAGELIHHNPEALFNTPEGAIAAGTVAAAPLVTPGAKYLTGKIAGTNTPGPTGPKYQAPQQAPVQMQQAPQGQR